MSGVTVGATARNLPATSDKMASSVEKSRASFMNHHKKKKVREGGGQVIALQLVQEVCL